MAASARQILLIDDDRLQYRLVQAHFKNFSGDRYHSTGPQPTKRDWRSCRVGRTPPVC